MENQPFGQDPWGMTMTPAAPVRRRRQPAWISLGLSAGFLLCYLVLPLYTFFGSGLLGVFCVVLNPVLLLPFLAMGMAIVSSIFFPRFVTAIITGASALVTLVLGAVGDVLVAQRYLSVYGGLSRYASMSAYYDSVSMSWGLVICVMLALGAMAAALIYRRPHAAPAVEMGDAFQSDNFSDVDSW